MAARDVLTVDNWRALPLGEALASLDDARRRLPRHGRGDTAAVVVVDMQNYFLRDGDPASDAAVAANETLLVQARAHRRPIFLLRVSLDDESRVSHTWRLNAAAGPLATPGHPAGELHAGLGRATSDIVITKRHASGFAGTALDRRLRAIGIDTLLLTGTSTSGCVRATAIDGAALGYRVLVVEECAYEPRRISGPVALYEIAARYADVISLDEASNLIGSVC